MIKNEMDTIRVNPAHITDIKELKVNGENISSLADIDNNILYVAKNGSDETGNGALGNPFLTINYANIYACSHLPSYPQRLVIYVFPGIYTEHLTTAFYRVYIVGAGWTLTEKNNPVIIKNTGEDEDHYPIGIREAGLNLIGIDVVTADDDMHFITGVYGRLQRASTFSYCHFRGGYFINEESDVGNIYQYMDECYFSDGDGFKIEGTTADYRYISLRNCVLSGATDCLFSGISINSTNTIKLDKCEIISKINIKGNFNYNMLWSELYDDAKITFDTDGFVNLFSSSISGGIHFYTDSPLTKKCIGCVFLNTPEGEGDMTGDESIEFIEYTGNHQYNGIDGEIITTSKIKNVGGGQNNYRNIHEALKGSLLTDTIINLEGDIEISEPLIINPSIYVQIDGNKKWSLTSTHATTLATLGAEQQLSFVNMKQIIGGKTITINGDGSSLSFVSCGRYTQPNYVNIVIANGDIASFVYIDKTTIIGTEDSTIKVSDIDPWLIIDRSFIKGAAANPAIEWTVDADSRFRIKYSTLLHGSGSTNSPLLNSEGGDITISMYNCALNAAFPVNDFTNNIGSSNNTVDPQIDY